MTHPIFPQLAPEMAGIGAQVAPDAALLVQTSTPAARVPRVCEPRASRLVVRSALDGNGRP